MKRNLVILFLFALVSLLWSNEEIIDKASILIIGCNGKAFDGNGNVVEDPIKKRDAKFIFYPSQYGNLVPASPCDNSEKILGPFTINDKGDKIRFAPGNLQFNAIEGDHAVASFDLTIRLIGTWRFAENQWDIISQDDNGKVDQNYDGWIDIFAWATSGWKNPEASNFDQPFYQPWERCSGKFGNGSFDIDASSDYANYANYDWGVYNEIRNGLKKDDPGVWRCLTKDEWQYLIGMRDTTLVGIGKVVESEGLILLPDDWKALDGVSFTGGISSLHIATNTYDEGQWAEMEKAGAVFLPLTVTLSDNCKEYQKKNFCYYWSTTAGDNDGEQEYAWCLYFNSQDKVEGNYVTISQNKRYEPCAVRLVTKY